MDCFEEADAVPELVVPTVVTRREELLDKAHVRRRKVDAVVSRLDGVAGTRLNSSTIATTSSVEGLGLRDFEEAVTHLELPRRAADGELSMVRMRRRYPACHVSMLRRPPCSSWTAIVPPWS